jgi:hypothetical protein
MAAPPIAAPGVETTAMAATAGYLRQWQPVPPASSVPAWARPGQVSFARWDGGPLETAKAMLSGWPNFNPPNPDYLYAMTNWYDPSTIGLLRRAGVNTVWVTFSNGFSIPTEQRQREMLRTYIAGCHRQAIHVMAYESAANLFCEDMYEHVPQSRQWVSLGKDGQPLPYGAANYSQMGRVTRHMADMGNPEWRRYVKRRIDLAIEAGADGVMYDNALANHLADFFQDIMRHALGRKPDFLIMANFHARHYILNRLLNAITTEDGGEAGIFSDANLQRPVSRVSGHDVPNRLLAQRRTMLPVEGGYLADNIGRFRVFENLSEGWKPVMIESGAREAGERMTHVMSAPRHQLVLAEGMMFNVATELFVEGRFAYGLWYGEPEIMKIWDAIGQYNRFFAENRPYYVGAKSLAALAVVLDNRSEGVEMLNALAGRNVLYHVLYEHELTSERLKPYAAVALLGAEMVRDEALAALGQYVRSGGKLFMAPGAARSNELGEHRRETPAWFGKKSGDGQSTCWQQLPAVDELARQLQTAARVPPVRLQAPPSVLYNVTEQSSAGRRIVHLLNYSPRPAQRVIVSVEGHYGQVTLLTPDGPSSAPRVRQTSDQRMEIEIPRLTIYALLVLGHDRPRGAP